MTLRARSRVLCSLTFLTVLLLGATPPKEAAPVEKSDPQADKQDPTKPRYVKITDPKIIKYAEYWYFNHQMVSSFEDARKWRKQEEQAPQEELEAYKQTPSPEKAVIRYIEGKVEKAKKKTKAAEEFFAILKEDFAEYQKTKRIPTWIIEKYNEEKAHEEYLKARDQEAKKTSRP